jgi:hypothetical protein
MTAPDVDTDIDVDLGKPIACIVDGCPYPATWRVVNHCEGRHALSLCTRHKLNEARFNEGHCTDLVCKFCRQTLVHPHVDWIQL